MTRGREADPKARGKQVVSRSREETWSSGLSKVVGCGHPAQQLDRVKDLYGGPYFRL